MLRQTTSISPLAFVTIPFYAATAKASGTIVADKPPGGASVKAQVTESLSSDRTCCDTMALENLNRLDYISRVLVTGVKADRP